MSKSAIRTASKAAEAAFDAYLSRNRATAAFHVPQCVIDAANAAFADADGEGEIEVIGHGNTTHPVCSVSVRRAKARR